MTVRFVVLVLLLIATCPGRAKTLCLEPSPGSGSIATGDCDQINPTEHQMQWTGFSEEYADLCSACPGPCWDTIGWEGCIFCAYAWSISSSATDPAVNVSTLPPDGWLYLWLHTTTYEVGGAARTSFRLSGTLTPLEFEPIYGLVDWTSDGFPDLSMQLGGCPDGPELIGRIQVQLPSPVGAGTWGRTKSVYR